MSSLKAAYDALAQERDNDEIQLSIDSRDEANEQDMIARSAPGSSLSAEHAAAVQAKRRRVEADVARISRETELQGEVASEMDDAPEWAFEPTDRELLLLALG